jgi:mRNA-degrading endonuclease toxin of MazEF toxin-antitoxin module
MTLSHKVPPVPQSGEIWIARIPNQPKDPHQPRPVVIVSTNSQNKYLDSVIAVPTSTSIGEPYPKLHVFLPRGTGGLPKDCYARCELVTTVDKTLLVKGPLDKPIDTKYRWQLIHGVLHALGGSAQ